MLESVRPAGCSAQPGHRFRTSKVSAGKDAAKGKLTFPGVHGVEASHRFLTETAAEAAAIAAGIESPAGPLGYFAAYVADRLR